MSPINAATSRRKEFALLAIFVAGLALYFTGRPASGPAPWLDSTPAGLYHELTDAFLAGQTSLLEKPAPELLKLSNPYDPGLNEPWRRDNVSYFRGAYYLYHSPAPVLVLFMPVRLLTGQYLAEDTAVAVFSLIGTIATLACVARLRRRFFPQSSSLLFALCAATVGLGSAQFAVLRNATANHAAIACAGCFLALAFYSALRALAFGPRHVVWLAVTGLAHGLAIASRPNYLFGSAALGLVAYFLRPRRTDPTATTKAFAVQIFALGVPLILVLASVAAYNFARYGNLVEFGTRTMLGAWDQTSLAPAGIGPVLQNAWHYFISPGEYARYFPFVSSPTWFALGVLPHLPFVCGALLLFAVKLRPATAAFAILVGGVFAANVLTLLALPSGNDAAVLASANLRYLVDFVPSLVLLACIGVMAAGQAWHTRPAARRTLAVAVTAGAFWSVLASVSQDCQRLPAESYRWFARIVNSPVALAEYLSGTEHGPLVLDLVFPSNRTGLTEPLLQTGSAAGGDLVWVRYENGGFVRFGHTNLAAGGPTGAAVKVDPSRPHRLEIALGSLTPPTGHPIAMFLSEPALAFWQRRVRITLDGVVVLDAASRSQPSTPDQIVLGTNKIGAGLTEPRFTGQILTTARAALVAPPLSSLPSVDYGALQLKILLPAHVTTKREPLVSTGVSQAGDIVFITYEDSNHIRVGFDHWGRGGPVSEPIAVDYATPMTVEVTMGSLYPPARHEWWSQRDSRELRYLKENLRVTVNGVPTLSAALGTFESSPFDVTIGRNLLGASSCALEFSGKILSAKRSPAPAAFNAR